jgi:hypothetical protein
VAEVGAGAPRWGPPPTQHHGLDSPCVGGVPCIMTHPLQNRPWGLTIQLGVLGPSLALPWVLKNQ